MGARDPSDGEDTQQRLNRELGELLQELRVALPGVQVLFAFLLTIPFSRGFPRVDAVERDVYFVAFLCALLSTALLIAPTAYHRVRFRHHDKERLVETSNRCALVGLAFLAVAMSCVVFVIGDYVFNRPLGVAVGAAAFVLFGWLWYALPLSRTQDRA